MKISEFKTSNLQQLIGDKELSLEINLGRIFIFLTLVYAVLFAGGIEPFYWSNPKKIYLLSLFSLIAPSVICFFLYHLFADKSFKFKISVSFVIKFLFIAILAGGYTFINYLHKFNLQCDEVGYAQISQIIPRGIYDLLSVRTSLIPLNAPVSFVIQIISLVLWTLIIAAYYFITASGKNVKIRLAGVLTFVCVFRLLIPNLIITGLTHPPLIYFVANLVSVFGGVNDKAFAISVLLLFLLFFGYLLHRIKISYVLYICMVLAILSVPVIGYWTYIYEQAIFAFFCFSVVIIEIYFGETEPVYLVSFVAISVLFRQSCVVAFLPLIPYTIRYLNRNEIKIISIKAFNQFAPGFFILPTFLYALWKGTPTTPALLDGYTGPKLSLMDKLANLDLVVAFYSVFNLYSLVMVIGLAILIYRKKFMAILGMSLICLGYLSLHLIGNMPKFDPKYYLEAYGFILVVSLVMFFTLISQVKYSSRIALSVTLLFLLYKVELGQKPVGLKVWPRDENSVLKGHENHFSYIHEYIKNNHIYNKSIVLGIDYGVFPFILNGVTRGNLEAIEKNRKRYFREKKGGWLDIDATCLQQSDSIEYVFIDDYLDKNGSNLLAIDSLSSVYGWQVVLNMPMTENTTGCIGLKRP